jgi:hypothetical protein
MPKKSTPKPEALVLTFKHKFTPEEKSAIGAKIKELEARIMADRKALAEAKRQEHAKGTAERITVTAAFRDDGVPIVTAADGTDVPLSKLSKGQAAQVFALCHAAKEVKA